MSGTELFKLSQDLEMRVFEVGTNKKSVGN